MLYLMIMASIILAVIVNVASSCYVCYNMVMDDDNPKTTLTMILGIVLLNTIVPYFLGTLTAMWFLV